MPLIGFTGIVIANPMAWFGSVAVLVPAYIIKYRQLKALEAGKLHDNSQTTGQLDVQIR